MPTAPDSLPHNVWPELPYAAWKDTCTTLQLWTQIVGKIQLVQTPWLNHSWHVTLRVSARGLSSAAIPYGSRRFEMEFDFIDHLLRIRTSDGASRELALRPRSVADFYQAVMTALGELGISVSINQTPNEVADPIPFSQDRNHSAYDPEFAQRFWRALLQVDRVFRQFRTSFLGKCSPVHFFWGSFDLAVTRFSGRRAPPHPGGVPSLPDSIAREAYSHEVSSAGFWPGGPGFEEAAFYSYAYPEPEGFRSTVIEPAAASFNETLGEFVLPYETVRAAADPTAVLLVFLQSTYEAAARTGKWDRDALECAPGRAGTPRQVPA